MNTLHKPLVPNEYPMPSEMFEDYLISNDVTEVRAVQEIANKDDQPIVEAHEVQSPLLKTLQRDKDMPLLPTEEVNNAAHGSTATTGITGFPETRPAELPPVETNVDDNALSDHELVQLGSLCRKRLIGKFMQRNYLIHYLICIYFVTGDHVYHVRFVWIDKTPKGMAFHWVIKIISFL